MLTLNRFQVLTEIYGGDLRRWPRSMREDAQSLLESSAAARVNFSKAWQLDAARAAARAEQDTVLWRYQIPDAQARRDRAQHGYIARAARIFWSLALPLRWVGMATVGGSAVMAGLVLGTLHGAAPASYSYSGLMLLLQSAPIHLLAN